MRRLAVIVAALGASIAPAPAIADDAPAPMCHAVSVSLQPERRTDVRPARRVAPQIVAWIEKPDGTYVATIFITQATGTYGLGNRPGRMDFNSGPLWPYGRRTSVFPVWADRKPERYDSVVFQDGDEDNLSHAFMQSSRELTYCRPMDPTGSTDAPLYDALSCATSMAYTDKGRRDAAQPSKYPPRQDVVRTVGTDDAAVDTYPAMNTFDAVSQATPAPGTLATFGWAQSADQPDGDYVLWVEVSTEYDHNDTYSIDARPAPTNIPYASSGEPYRGQPSLVYSVPFSVGEVPRAARTATYAGYGDPDGVTGRVHAPDATISTGLVGSGAERLALVRDPDGDYRVLVRSSTESDATPPAVAMQFDAAAVTARTATFTFLAPGDDGVTGRAQAYEARYRVGSAITEDNFTAADSYVVPMNTPGAAGTVEQLALEGLLPGTEYAVGVRAVDDCGNRSPVAMLDILTNERAAGEVEACFVATAAYGSTLASEVGMLRGLRDRVLRRTVLGELAVEAYYTFSPPVAGLVGESEVLRSSAREMLRPLVRYVRSLAW